jgi:hypothetical protein
MPDLDGYTATLKSVYDNITNEFSGDAAVLRLQQFQYHMQTALMAMQHLYDEAERMRGPNDEDIYRSNPPV